MPGLLRRRLNGAGTLAGLLGSLWRNQLLMWTQFSWGVNTMRAFLLAAIATVVLAVGTAYVLESIQETTEVANMGSGASVREN
jgi:branched-subunit amino acid transport protein